MTGSYGAGRLWLANGGARIVRNPLFEARSLRLWMTGPDVQLRMLWGLQADNPASSGSIYETVLELGSLDPDELRRWGRVVPWRDLVRGIEP